MGPVFQLFNWFLLTLLTSYCVSRTFAENRRVIARVVDLPAQQAAAQAAAAGVEPSTAAAEQPSTAPAEEPSTAPAEQAATAQSHEPDPDPPQHDFRENQSRHLGKRGRPQTTYGQPQARSISQHQSASASDPTTSRQKQAGAPRKKLGASPCRGQGQSACSSQPSATMSQEEFIKDMLNALLSQQQFKIDVFAMLIQWGALEETEECTLDQVHLRMKVRFIVCLYLFCISRFND